MDLWRTSKEWISIFRTFGPLEGQHEGTRYPLSTSMGGQAIRPDHLCPISMSKKLASTIIAALGLFDNGCIHLKTVGILLLQAPACKYLNNS